MIYGKPWSSHEEQILINNPHRPTGYVQQMLNAAGFNRSLEAIERKKRRLGVLGSAGVVYSPTNIAGESTVTFTCVDGPSPPVVSVPSVFGPYQGQEPTWSFHPQAQKPQPKNTQDIKYVSGPLPLMGGSETRFVMFNDVHVPHNIPIENILHFVSDYKPHYVLLVGDIVNNDPFSHWDRQSPLRFKNMPQPKPYYELCNKLFYRPLRQAAGKDSKFIHHIGNHEYWSNKAIAEMPEGQGYWEVENNIEEVDAWVESKGIINLGKLHFVHGDIVKGRVHAQTMLNYFRRNIRYGHFHDIMEHSYNSPIDQSERHTARSCGTLEQFNPHFMANRPHNWMHAFTYGVVFASGNFSDDTKKLVNNSFHAEGKLYGSL